jgi:hypothetical protein
MLRPMHIELVLHDTARVARAAFPKGNRYLRLADLSVHEGWGRKVRSPSRGLCDTWGGSYALSALSV